MSFLFNRIFDLARKLDKKSNSKSIQIREEGNRLYHAYETFEAIKYYNRALNFAKSKENRAFAYANRSAVYLEVGKYRECLENIKLARRNGYPTQNMRKLIEREEKCLNLMKIQKEEDPENDPWNYIKLSYTANEKVPYIIKDLEVRRTVKYGRGIYATRDLKAGDIICIEDILSLIQTNDDYILCANCFKTNMLNLIPCLKTASYMYCSTKCRDEFYLYADFEELPLTNLHLRTLCKKLEFKMGGRNAVQEFLENSITNQTFFDVDFSDPEKYDVNICKSFLLTFQDYFKNNNSGFHVKLFQLLYMDAKAFKKGMFSDEHFKTRHFMAFGISPFYNLLNSSCVPNIDHIFVDGKLVIYVKRPISANSQLFVGYHGEFFEMSKAERRSFNLLYNFVCDCIACEQNLTKDDLKAEIPSDYDELVENIIFSKEFLSIGEIMEHVKSRCEIMNKYREPTSKEVILIYRELTFSLMVLANKIMFPVE